MFVWMELDWLTLQVLHTRRTPSSRIISPISVGRWTSRWLIAWLVALIGCLIGCLIVWLIHYTVLRRPPDAGHSRSRQMSTVNGGAGGGGTSYAACEIDWFIYCFMGLLIDILIDIPINMFLTRYRSNRSIINYPRVSSSQTLRWSSGVRTSRGTWTPSEACIQGWCSKCLVGWARCRVLVRCLRGCRVRIDSVPLCLSVRFRLMISLYDLWWCKRTKNCWYSENTQIKFWKLTQPDSRFQMGGRFCGFHTTKAKSVWYANISYTPSVDSVSGVFSAFFDQSDAKFDSSGLPLH